MQPVPPLRIALRPSKYGRFALVVIHGLTVVAIWAASLPLSMVMLGLGLVVVSLWRLRFRSMPDALILYGDGRLQKVGAGGTASEIELLPETTVIGPLIVLSFRESGKLVSLVLLPDSLNVADDGRRLKRWLRWQSDQRATS